MSRGSNSSSSWNPSSWLLFVSLVVLCTVLIWRWSGIAPFGSPELGNDPTAKAREVAAPGASTTEEKNRIEVFSTAKASVVNITSAKIGRDGFSLSTQHVPKGSGTGFIWDEKGRVVTNYHVVQDANHILVTLDDHTTWKVHQVKYDAANDLAVLWTDIPTDKVKPIPLGESSKLQVGQTVLAIGNPFGLDHSLSSGIISALGRDLKGDDQRIIRGMIQTDAAINPGNSGGPLLDSSGRLIGVNTAIISPSGSSSGVGFAIPVDVVNRVVPRLIRGGKTTRPSLGIVEAPDQWARQRGIVGVLVIDVVPNGPAQKADLRPTYRDDAGRIIWGDVIVGIDKTKVRSVNELYTLLADQYAIGQTVTVQLLRDAEIRSIPLTLSAELR